ncbi:MAG: P-loop NTPase [Bacteroides sp.]|nr:P-loop NTPase [Prevotella sp.]MCM1406991.1 P-loop NTPase [Treponema brennaborense]MCM1470142.1 P-loop NTPase [Bacteroides sp.]
MSAVIPVAGGKGGVGKSVFSLNFAIALTQRCKRVILCDLDLGGSNLHTMLGLKNNQKGLGHFIYKQETDMSALLQATGIPNLQFIAGDCLFPGAANMDFFTKQRIIREIQKLNCDFVILDLGAGTSYNITDFFLTAPDGIIVITPELTSVLNAYSFLKSAVFRFCYRLYPPKSPERTILINSMLKKIEGKDYSFPQILDVIDSAIPGSGRKARSALQTLTPRIIMNMGRKENDAEMAYRLGNLAYNKLATKITYLGFVPHDESVSVSVAYRQPMATLYPHSKFYSVFAGIAAKICAQKPAAASFSLEEAQEDFADIVKKFYEKQVFSYDE